YPCRQMKIVANVSLPPARHRLVDRHRDGAVARRLGTLDKSSCNPTVAEQRGGEPALSRHLGDRLQWHRGKHPNHQKGVLGPGRARGRQLARMMSEPVRTCWCDEHGPLEAISQYLGGKVDLPHPDQDCGE